MKDDTERKIIEMGFAELPQDPTAAQITFYGWGGQDPGDLSGLQVGEPVEVLTDQADGGGRGVWQKGLVALSGVVEATPDGNYPGEQVVWVGWESGYLQAPATGEKPEGNEWPVDALRRAEPEVEQAI